MNITRWLAAVVFVALALAATRCDRNVTLGVDPGSDAAAGDAGDAGADN
jgi:hypothetical protein